MRMRVQLPVVIQYKNTVLRITLRITNIPTKQRQKEGGNERN
jgi:hypothetical protein